MATIERLDTREILAGIIDWVKIESPTDDPRAVNRMVARAEADFAAAGLAGERVACGGFGDCLRVRSPWGGDRPGILVVAHLDTVHPLGTLARLPVAVAGDRLFGPGTYDMKGGGFIAFHALRQLVREGRETALPITLLYVSDEELGSEVSRPITESEARRQKYALIVEPCRDGGAIVTSRKGLARFTVTFAGRPSHAGMRHQDGRSAVREMAHQILAVESLTDYDRGVTVNVGLVNGGTRPNVVPEFAEMKVDMRFPDQETAKAAVDSVLALKSLDGDVTMTVQGSIKRPPFARTREVIALFDVAKAAAANHGIDLREVSTGGASDGNFTAPVIPTLDGLGVDGAGAHTLEEHLLISSLAPRSGLLMGLFESLR